MSLVSAKEKARISAGLYLESQIDHAVSIDKRKDFGLNSMNNSCQYAGSPRWCTLNGLGEGSNALMYPNANNVVTIQTSGCIRGDCMDMGGGYMFIPSPDPSIDDLFANGGTISLWFKQTDPNQISDDRVLVTRSGSLFSNGYGITVNNANKIRFGIGNTSSDLYIWSTSVGSVIFGKWNHVAVMYNRDLLSNEPKVFVNGRLMQLTKDWNSRSGAYSDSAYEVGFGAESPSGGRRFYGMLDEIRLYSIDTAFQNL